MKKARLSLSSSIPYFYLTISWRFTGYFCFIHLQHPPAANLFVMAIKNLCLHMIYNGKYGAKFGQDLCQAILVVYCYCCCYLFIFLAIAVVVVIS